MSLICSRNQLFLKNSLIACITWAVNYGRWLNFKTNMNMCLNFWNLISFIHIYYWLNIKLKETAFQFWWTNFSLFHFYLNPIRPYIKMTAIFGNFWSYVCHEHSLDLLYQKCFPKHFYCHKTQRFWVMF